MEWKDEMMVCSFQDMRLACPFEEMRRLEEQGWKILNMMNVEGERRYTMVLLEKNTQGRPMREPERHRNLRRVPAPLRIPPESVPSAVQGFLMLSSTPISNISDREPH